MIWTGALAEARERDVAEARERDVVEARARDGAEPRERVVAELRVARAGVLRLLPLLAIVLPATPGRAGRLLTRFTAGLS